MNRASVELRGEEVNHGRRLYFMDVQLTKNKIDTT
jgi:hypothetical protein